MVLFQGCSPSEKIVIGQVFIVTRGSENIKLGLVAVSLVEKSEVEKYLAAKQKEHDSKAAVLQNAFAVAKTNLDFAKSSYAAFEVQNAVAIATNLAIVKELESLLDKYSALVKDLEWIKFPHREARFLEMDSLKKNAGPLLKKVGEYEETLGKEASRLEASVTNAETIQEGSMTANEWRDLLGHDVVLLGCSHAFCWGA